MIREPQNREQAIRPVIEKLEGKLVGYWFAFGESDAVIIVQLPDHVSAAAASLAATGSGAIKSLKTTVLMSVDEACKRCARPAARATARPADQAMLRALAR